MAEKSSNLLQQFKERLTCSICLEQYKEPKGLPCQHSFCEDCLGHLALELHQRKYFLKCPTCRKLALLPDGGVSAFPPAFTINSFHELHQLMLAKGDSVECSEHNEPLDICCHTCKRLICHKCIYRSHKSHHHDLAVDVLEQCRMKIKERHQHIEQNRFSISNACSAVGICKREIEEQGEEVKKQIHQQNEQIKEVLDEAEKQLSEEVDTVVREKLYMLSLQEEEAKRCLVQMQSLETCIKQCIKIRSAQHVLYSMECLIKEVDEVCSQASQVGYLPVESADTIFSVNSDALIKARTHLGRLTHSQLHQKCHVIRENGEKVHFRQSSCFQVHCTADHMDGSLIDVPAGMVSCQLTALAEEVSKECAIREISQGRYEVNYTPETSGPHQLRVTVGGRDITGSPFNVQVIEAAVPLPLKGRLVEIATDIQNPYGIAISKTGMMVVTESDAHCITVLNKQGKRIRSFGSQGIGPGQFKYWVCGVTVTAHEQILVIDHNNHRIQLFSMDGQFIQSVGELGSGPGQLFHPKGVCTHPNGQIFVADTYNHRICVFNQDLSFSHSIGRLGSKSGELNYPSDVAIDGQGRLYVTDSDNNRIQVFDSSGKYVTHFSRRGFRRGLLSHPVGIAIDLSNNIYVSEHSSSTQPLHQVSVFTSSGKFLSSFNGRESGSKKLSYPKGLAVDVNENVYVCDSANSRLVMF